MNMINVAWVKFQRILTNKKYRVLNRNKDFTLISQNCVGG